MLAPERLLMFDLAGKQLTPDERAFLAEHPVGGICLFARNIVDRYQTADLTAELRELCGERLLVATDQEGGGVVRSLDVPYPPGAMALAAANDLALTEAVAAATARGLRAQGINLDFAPVADVNTNSRNPVVADRAFGEDPNRVAAQVVAFVRGLQREGVAACVKHFPGHGATEIDSHLGLPTLDADLARLEATEFVPFRAAIAEGVAGVMSAHIVLPSFGTEPATLSPEILKGLLRERLGFGGVVFTDALNMRAIADRTTPGEAVVGALAAGADMPVQVGSLAEHRQVVHGLSRAVAEGRLETAALEASLQRVSALAQAYPAQPEPDAAWQPGDEALLMAAAQRALVRFGKIAFEGSLTLVAAQQVRASAASQATVSPVSDLAAALDEEGLPTTLLAYDRATLAETRADLLKRVAQAPGRVVFVSTGRTRMGEDEREFARAVARAAPSFAHLALWNPYHVDDLPGPALVSFGFREWSLRAVARTRGEAVGISPVRLEPQDSKSQDP